MKKIFSKRIVYPFFTLLGIVGIFDWIVFPLLTAADTFGNILGVVIGFFTMVFAFYSLKIDAIISKYLNSDGLIDSTELKEAEQMMNKKEFDELCKVEADSEVKEVTAKPKAKRKPKVTKSEYPLPPHHPVSKVKKTK